MSKTLLTRPLLHSGVAEAVYREITTRSGKYYYYLGTTIEPHDQDVSAFADDNIAYERFVRKNIILIKEIQPSDVAFVVPRIDWVPGRIYDMYDDAYSDKIEGINILDGGNGYSSNVDVIFEGGDGFGARANAVIQFGRLVGIEMIDGGTDYSLKPNVIIIDNGGTGNGAVVDAIMNFNMNGGNTLYTASYYALTDDKNIYKCLDNNNRRLSTVKPIEVTPEPFITEDGYKWKYIGSIPVPLDNRFTTKYSFPVLNALSNQFYSKGEINQIITLDSGDGYTFANIIVEGDGHRKDEPIVITGLSIVNGGEDYTTANVTISPPVSKFSIFNTETYYQTGKVLKSGDNYYEVVNTGNTGLNPPVHVFGTEINGDTELKFVGKQINADVTIDNGEIDSIENLYGIVNEIFLTNSGSGYTSNPDITFDGDGDNTIAYSVVTNSNVSRIVLISGGDGYTQAPNVIIGTEWTANSNVALGEQLFSGVNLYTVSQGGITGNVEPTHTANTEVNGSANLTYAGFAAKGYSTLKYGLGYKSAPIVTVNGDGSNAEIITNVERTKAILFPVIENGRITRLHISDGGVGYTYANIIVDGDGDNARFRVNFATGDLTTPQSTVELSAVDGAIHAIKMISNGYNYNDANVTIIGDGENAEATAEILNGKVRRLNIINEGKNYTWADVIIQGDGYGATARAILPPMGGHGRNIINELYARNLALYSTIGFEKSHGLLINNDYRQFGIIKDVENYDNTRYFNDRIGSACWLIYSDSIDINKFKQDVIVKRVSDDAEFLIVASESKKMIILSLSNRIPAIGDELIDDTLTVISINNVMKPEFNAFSGKMLLIDNRVEFAVSEEQALALRTILQF